MVLALGIEDMGIQPLEALELQLVMSNIRRLFHWEKEKYIAKREEYPPV